jgi:hypothetical protein
MGPHDHVASLHSYQTGYTIKVLRRRATPTLLIILSIFFL